ncbi:type IX secretion system ring protein PorN/GldN [Capnocytophaga canimorsus]|uniref:type IX secretion system ring protein PorN/GldN n=1 Tax=Capnocytophaga canimorsus TaxID=28188 RepID=UPI001EDDB1EF|nr:gliding motility protein GldN [Capnocytophaga canimorsus]GJQ05681.1 gliding motility protein GldO [Capnocytophaga canimorsus]
MFNWKNIGICVALFPFFGISTAQVNLLNAKLPSEIQEKSQAKIDADNDRPLPYGYVDERDVLWQTEVWEVIDLNERVNFPLLYPIHPEDMSDYRKSLYNVLIENIKSGKITEVYADSYFTKKKTYDEIKHSLMSVDTLDAGYELLNAGEQITEEYITKREISPEDILQYRIRGLWYFDKRQGELKYRLLGIAPVATDVSMLGDLDMAQGEEVSNAQVELFWVWYPSVRDILHEAKTFNRKNSARPLSFDHLLNSRMFSSVIYKEDNVQGDRPIKDYIHDNSLFQLLESDRIREKIRDREQDMWAN